MQDNDLTIWKDGQRPSCAVSPEQMTALDLFLKYNTLAFISETLNKPTATVRDWIYVGRNSMRPFSEIRTELECEQIKELTKHKRPLMQSIVDSSLYSIKTSLETIKKSKQALSIEEVKKLSDIVGNLDKILKLDSGVATENIAIAKVNPINNANEIKEIISSVDDFDIFDIEE